LKHILVTGGSGFVGKVLLGQLLSAGHRVTYTSAFQIADTPLEENHIILDIRDQIAVNAVVDRVRPSHVIHLAAISSVAGSFQDPVLAWNTNVMGSLNILEAIKKHSPETVILFTSSSEVYGEAFKSGAPLDEDSRCQPMNPYAASKLAAELACTQYFRQGIRGVITRPFNHIGPGQSPEFVTASFARQIALIEAGKQAPIINVGNLEASRDFLNVQDVCSAYLVLLELESPKHNLYNISSGKACKVAEILDVLLRQSVSKIEIKLDPERLRPSDIPFAVGDSQRLTLETTWEPKIPLTESLCQVLEYWRHEVNTH
jgi:GDP-4-dehydro-6-deoxy-D-mannose reductase